MRKLVIVLVMIGYVLVGGVLASEDENDEPSDATTDTDLTLQDLAINAPPPDPLNDPQPGPPMDLSPPKMQVPTGIDAGSGVTITGGWNDEQGGPEITIIIETD